MDAAAAVRVDIWKGLYFEFEEKLLYARYFGVKVDQRHGPAQPQGQRVQLQLRLGIQIAKKRGRVSFLAEPEKAPDVFLGYRLALDCAECGISRRSIATSPIRTRRPSRLAITRAVTSRN